MERNKCRTCGKYRMQARIVEKKKYEGIFDEIEIPIFRFWKWCEMNNNWCRNIAGKCGEVISEKDYGFE